MSRRLTAALTLAAFASVALAGCAGSPAPTVPTAAPADFAPINVTGIPYWKTGTLPDGWVQDSIPKDAVPNVSAADAETVIKLNPPTAFNADRTCYIQVQTTFLPAHSSGRSDSYLSKFNLYQQADMFQAATEDEAVITFTSDQGKLDAYSAIIDRDPTMFGVAPTSATASTGTWVAGRAFDVVTDNPMVAISARVAQSKAGTSSPAPTPPSEDNLKGIPVAGMSVACQTPEQFKALNLTELVNSFTLITK